MGIQAAALYALVGVQGAGQSVRDLQSVSNQVNKTQGTMSQLGKNAGQIGKGFTQVGAGLLRIGEIAAVAAGGAILASAKIGTTFQQQMELIHTQAGATQQEVTDQSKAIEDLVHRVGTTPDALAKGLYHIESVGVRGGAALDILRVAALGAKVGLADMETTSNALTGIWFSGIRGAKDMAGNMEILNAIIGVGNMRMQDLVDSFGTGILGTSKTFGIGLRDMGAALAVLTDAQVPAQVAATRMQMMFTHMAAPIPAAVKILKSLGLSQFDLAKDLRKPDGIFVALDDLRTHLERAGEGAMKNGIFTLTPQGTADVAKLFGGSRFGAAAMQLLGMADRVKLKYDQIGQQQGTFGEKVARTMETAGFVWGQFRADIENSALAFSEGFLPALARAGSKLDLFLVGHRTDIKAMGVELGAWLDSINWTQVEDGANTFIGLLKTAVELISKVPPQVDAAVGSFLVLNKLSGGLLGAGAGNIAGGLLGGLGTLGKGALRLGLSKIPVIGGAAAALTSTPVFVTNWPGGFGLPGTPPGPAVPPGVVSPTTTTGPTGILQALGVGLAGFMFGSQVNAAKNDAAANAPKGSILAMITDPNRNPFQSLAQQSGPDPNVTAYGGFDKRFVVTPAQAELNAKRIEAAENRSALTVAGAVTGTGGRTVRALDALHVAFRTDLHGLIHATKAIDIGKFARNIAKEVRQGVGSGAGTSAILKDLHIKLAETHDPKLTAILRTAIRQVEEKLPGRVWADQEIANARRILASNESQKTQLTGIAGIERQLRAEGYTHAAAVVDEIARKKWHIQTTNINTINNKVQISSRDTIATQETVRTRGNVYLS